MLFWNAVPVWMYIKKQWLPVLFGPLEHKPKKEIRTFGTTTPELLTLYAEWIAQLLRSGLIEGSFVPPVEIRDLRDLTRYRKKLLQDATQEKNRIHKVLQDANIKITTYISDIFGVSDRNIMESLLDGEVITAEKITKMVKGKVKSKVPGLVDALNNRLRRHHREMIRYSWDHLQFLERTILNVESRIDECLSR